MFPKNHSAGAAFLLSEIRDRQIFNNLLAPPRAGFFMSVVSQIQANWKSNPYARMELIEWLTQMLSSFYPNG